MKNLEIKSPLPMVLAGARKLRPYTGFLLFLFFAAIYGLTLMRINTYSNPVIDESEVLTKAKSSATPRIDTTAAEKLKSLEDNSVNVKTLFDKGRTSPFDE